MTASTEGVRAADEGAVLATDAERALTVILRGVDEVQQTVRDASRAAAEQVQAVQLVAQSSAKVNASVEGNNVSVVGNVTGSVHARGRLSLSGSGTLNGDVRVAKLSVEDGATLNGNVSMGQPVGGGKGPSAHVEQAEAEQAVEEPQPEAVG